jgi:hypothetical protein
MNNEAMKEVLNELFSHLERLETQTEAILQFLKEKKRVTDKQLAPYLEQAGNASNVRWRAARVRIEHLLAPEHPEEEIKLGKPPELQEDSSSAASSEEKRSESDAKKDKRVESVDEEGKRTGSRDQKQIESSDEKVQRAKSSDQGEPAPAEAAQALPADGKAAKPEMKSESAPEQNKKNAEAKGDEKPDSDDVRHPTEVTAPLAEKEGAEPAAQLNSKDKDDDQEAA